MGFCTLNDIGEYLADHDDRGEPAQLRVDIPKDDVLVREGIFTRDGDAFAFSRKGLERFLARRFGKDHKDVVHSGNACCLGTVQGRTLYYSTAPRPNFFSLHGEDTSVILGSNGADVPRDWKGRAVLLSNLFTVKDGKIVFVKAGLKLILPASGEPRKASRARKPHARRKFWLEFLCHYVSDLQQGKDMAGGRRAAQLARPTAAEVLEWLRSNTRVTITSERTIRRDIKAFESFDPNKDAYDKRDGLISGIWKHLEDPEFVQNPKTLQAITDEMARIDAPEVGGYAVTAAFAKTLFEDDADANRRNPTRTIAADHGMDIDKDLSA